MTDLPDRICGVTHVYRGVTEVCTLDPHGDDIEHRWERPGAFIRREADDRAAHRYRAGRRLQRRERHPEEFCPHVEGEAGQRLVCYLRPHPAGTPHELVTVRELLRRGLAEDGEQQRRGERAEPGCALGRTQDPDDPRWRAVHEADPDAWRPPDPIERDRTPDAAGPAPTDVAGHPAGAGEGRTMAANAEEMVAAIGGVIAHIRLWQEQARVAHENIDASIANAQSLMGGLQVNAVIQATAALSGARESTETALGQGEAAIEHLAAWSAAISAANS